VGIVKVASDAILMRSVFCFEMSPWPPRQFLDFWHGEKPMKILALLLVLPAFSVVVLSIVPGRYVIYGRLLTELGDHSLIGDVSEQKALSWRKNRFHFGKKEILVHRLTVSSQHGFLFNWFLAIREIAAA